MDYDFGFKPKEKDPYLPKLIKRAKAIDPITSHLLLIGWYHRHFNICDHNSFHSPPIPELAFHEKEDIMSGNLLFEIAEKYHEKQILKYFGVSLAEYMQFPKFYCDHLAELADKFAQKEIKLASELQNSISGKKDNPFSK